MARMSSIATEVIPAYRFVNQTSTTAAQASNCLLADSGDLPVGITQNGAAAIGDACDILGPGEIALLEVDGGTAIAAGDFLMPHTDSTGKGLKSTTDKDKYGAIAIDPSSADGDVIRVWVTIGERSTS